MAKRSGYERFCSLARGLDIVGERWSLVIIQELLHRGLRYGELRQLLPGIGSNVLAERLRAFEAHGIVERVPGAVGGGVTYALTDRGQQLAPVLASFRRWALDELLPIDVAEPARYNLSYAVPDDLDLAETYEWVIDGEPYALTIDGTTLTVAAGPANRPVIVVSATREFMYRWVEGATTWDQGRGDGEVTVNGDVAAWERMLLATGYPARPAGIADRLRTVPS